MNSVPAWRLAGDWFDICSCDIPCPCEFAQAPTNNVCEAMLAWHVRQGHFGDVRLDGLNLLALSVFEGNLWTGEAQARMGLFIDERADGRQREALQAIFSGQAGGWPATFAATIGEFRGVEFAPIAFEVADDLASWRAEIPGRVVGRVEALSGPTTPPGKRVQTINPPGSEVGPGQVATWGRSVEARTQGFGFNWTGESRSSKHIPFDWTATRPRRRRARHPAAHRSRSSARTRRQPLPRSRHRADREPDHLAPTSKLATAKALDLATAASSLGEVLGLGPVDEDGLYTALDWLLASQWSRNARRSKPST